MTPQNIGRFTIRSTRSRYLRRPRQQSGKLPFSVSTQPCQERPAERSISEASGTLSTHHPREKKEKRPSLTVGRWGARLSPEKRRKLNHPGAIWTHWRLNQPADGMHHRLHVASNGGGKSNNGSARPHLLSARCNPARGRCSQGQWHQRFVPARFQRDVYWPFGVAQCWRNRSIQGGCFSK